MVTKTLRATLADSLRMRLLLGAAVMVPLALPHSAFSQTLPQGGAVAGGAARIGSAGGITTITQTSDRAVINWASFDVGAGNSVAFRQPGVNSATLNRVTGTTPSSIAGSISATGTVFLVNPNGIAITGSGNVSTGGGFVASTLDIADGDFMAGRLAFAGKGASAGVSNAGRINVGSGGFVALLGGSVANSGSIVVPIGRVALGSGEAATLDINGNGFLQVAVPSGTLADTLIAHSGQISAAGGLVELKAATVKDAVRQVVNLSGSINADSATGDGGTIRLLGGDGGAVTATGSLSARATGATGDGGSIETSGASVAFTGLKVDASSVGGKTGTWLVDPTDLTVDAASAATISTNLVTANVKLVTNSDGTTSGPGVTSAGNGDITVASAINWASSNTLELSAYRNVVVNANITASGASAGLTLRSDNSGTGTGTVSFGAGDTANLSGATSTAKLYYNPTAYTTRTSFTGNVTAHTTTAYMLVNTLANLQAVGGALSGTYAMSRDIDATATSGWNAGAGFAPIGTQSAAFTGTFDGQGHVISNLYINSAAAYTGLFGQISGATAMIANLNLLGGSVTSTNLYTGALAGTATSSATISNDTSSVAVNSSSFDTGGLIGVVSNSAHVTNSSASGAVTRRRGQRVSTV